jgi:hypothetical protein
VAAEPVPVIEPAVRRHRGPHVVHPPGVHPLGAPPRLPGGGPLDADLFQARHGHSAARERLRTKTSSGSWRLPATNPAAPRSPSTNGYLSDHYFANGGVGDPTWASSRSICHTRRDTLRCKRSVMPLALGMRGGGPPVGHRTCPQVSGLLVKTARRRSSQARAASSPTGRRCGLAPEGQAAQLMGGNPHSA